MRIFGPLVCSTTLAETVAVGEGVRGGGDVVAVDQQHGRERDLVAGLAVDLLDGDDVADGHLVLLAAGLDDRVHRRTAPKLEGRSAGLARLAAADVTTSAAQDSRVRKRFGGSNRVSRRSGAVPARRRAGRAATARRGGPGGAVGGAAVGLRLGRPPRRGDLAVGLRRGLAGAAPSDRGPAAAGASPSLPVGAPAVRVDPAASARPGRLARRVGRRSGRRRPPAVHGGHAGTSTAASTAPTSPAPSDGRPSATGASTHRASSAARLRRRRRRVSATVACRRRAPAAAIRPSPPRPRRGR